MSETEKLIEIVRQHPVLYDLRNREYKNIKKKDKVWDEISKSFGGNGDELKRKWKNLRDSYAKHLRSEKTHTGQEMKILERYKTWPWAIHMEFLRPSLQLSKTCSNVTNQPVHDQDTLNENHEVGDKDQEENSQPSDQQECQKKSVSGPREITPKSTRKRKVEETPVQQVLTYLEKRNSNTVHTDVDLLFMSFSKTVQNFSPRRQTMVKFKFSQILMEEELAQQAENEQNNHGRMGASTCTRPSSSASPLSPLPFVPDAHPERGIRSNSSTSWYEDFGGSLDCQYENL